MAVDVDYARKGEISIAFQAVGSGPVDLIFGSGLISHMDLLWADPRASEFLRGLAGLGRLLLFDKPGTGLSDPVVGPPTVEERVGDFLAVLDAAGSKRAIVIGFSEASAPATLLAATHPHRVEGLVLLSGAPRLVTGPDFLPEEEARFNDVLWRALWRAADHWGDGEFLMTLSPFVRRSLVHRRLAPSIERSCASPGMARALIHGVRAYDVTHILESVRTPTLVVHRTEEFIPVSCARYTAERIPDSRLVEVPGDEHMVYFDGDGVLDVIADFVGGHRPTHAGVDRRLTTLLFTDIVNSTAAAADLGDERWRSLLAQHDRILDDEIERHDGRIVKNLGDGIFATFDRPMMAIRCALAARNRVRDLGISLRAGVHTGECEVVGADFSGIAVHVGSRISSLATSDEVLVSSTVRDLVFGSGIEFVEHGRHVLKGVPGEWTVYAVADDTSRDQRPPHLASAEEAALTPGPEAAMKGLDRAMLQVVTRSPRLARAALSIGSRLSSRRE